MESVWRSETTASRCYEGQPCFASTHQLSGSDILKKLYGVIVELTTRKKTI